MALCGVSELAEIAVIRGMELDADIPGVLDPNAEVERFAGRPVWRSVDNAGHCDGFILTELAQPADRHQMLVAAFGEHRVVVPDIIARFASG